MERIAAILIAIMIVLSSAFPVFADMGINKTVNESRIGGNDRYSTSLLIAEKIYKKSGGFSNVVLAYGGNFPDALSGGYLAERKNAPIILVDKAHETKVANAINKYMNYGGTVYLLGGKNAISSSFEKSLRGKYNVVRLSGSTRYSTNLEILRETVRYGDELLVASGKNYADSLSGSAVSKGMLLVGDNLTHEQINWIRNAGIRKFYILGGNKAVSQGVENILRQYAEVERISGKSRYETSKLIAKKFFSKSTSATLTTGQNFPDGLSGAPLAKKYKAPILLVADKKHDDARKYVEGINLNNMFIIGGTNAISNKTKYRVLGGAYKDVKLTTSMLCNKVWKWTGHDYNSKTKYDYALEFLYDETFKLTVIQFGGGYDMGSYVIRGNKLIMNPSSMDVNPWDVEYFAPGYRYGCGEYELVGDGLFMSCEDLYVRPNALGRSNYTLKVPHYLSIIPGNSIDYYL